MVRDERHNINLVLGGLNYLNDCVIPYAYDLQKSFCFMFRCLFAVVLLIFCFFCIAICCVYYMLLG